jgi:hypothetical protein
MATSLLLLLSGKGICDVGSGLPGISAWRVIALNPHLPEP